MKVVRPQLPSALVSREKLVINMNINTSNMLYDL